MWGVQSWLFIKVNAAPKINVPKNITRATSPEVESFPSESLSTAAHMPEGTPRMAVAIQVAWFLGSRWNSGAGGRELSWFSGIA